MAADANPSAIHTFPCLSRMCGGVDGFNLCCIFFLPKICDPTKCFVVQEICLDATTRAASYAGALKGCQSVYLSGGGEVDLSPFLGGPVMTSCSRHILDEYALVFAATRQNTEHFLCPRSLHRFSEHVPRTDRISQRPYEIPALRTHTHTHTRMPHFS